MIETEKRVREAVRYLGFGRNEDVYKRQIIDSAREMKELAKREK